MPNFSIKTARKYTFAKQLISHSAEPLIMQQLHRRKILCDYCDNVRIGKVEGQFCSKLLYPYLDGAHADIPYGIWLQKFAISLAWRITSIFLADKMLNSARDIRLAQEAKAIWRRFLLGHSTNPGPYQHYIHLFDYKEIDRYVNYVSGRYATPLPDYVYSWMLGTTDFSILKGDNRSGGLMVFAKFAGGVMLSGLSPAQLSDRPAIARKGRFPCRHQYFDLELFGFCIEQIKLTKKHLEKTVSADFKTTLNAKLARQLAEEKALGLTYSHRLATYLRDLRKGP